jgi:hypothetical protein
MPYQISMRVKFKIWGFLLLFFASAYLMLTSSYRIKPGSFHTVQELRALHNREAPIQAGQYFLGSSNCQGCHGPDPMHIANIDTAGHDVDVYNGWQSTMMAMSARDPMWRAKVSHEILVDSAHALTIQMQCTSCHAPMGHFTAVFKGATQYTLTDLMGDTLGLNGVACGGCHEIGSDSAGLAFSGGVNYDTSKVEYGPFVNPVTGPMQLYVGLTPTYTTHTERSQFCASCHTLITPVYDSLGNATGNNFIEQATYHEWLNSNFNPDRPCQSCHMPQLQEGVIIADGYLNLTPRSPFNQHKFMGGNSMMLKLIQANQASLGTNVPDSLFDKTIAATLNLLQNSTINLTTQVDSVTSDTLFVSVQLVNNAGHKFPSGYPSRRAFIQLAVTNGSDTLFQSGTLPANYEFNGQGQTYQPHYNVISNPAQVQIYEMVMGSADSSITTVLERCAMVLKDNRLPPQGFTTSFYAYDTALIVGNALNDPDFNYSGGSEGSGSDIVHYHIPLNGFTGVANVASAVYYQSLPPHFLNDMFNYQSSYIDSFKSMYQLADKSPVLIAYNQVDSLVITKTLAIEKVEADDWKVYPVPSLDGMIMVQNTGGLPVSRIEVWDSKGQRVNVGTINYSQSNCSFSLPQAAGVYYLKIISGQLTLFKKVVRQ